MRDAVSSPLAVAAPGGEPGANERGSGLSAPLPPRTPWRLPARGLAVFQGDAHTARLSHYFLPRVLLQGKRVLMLDGANCADPRLLERLARQRGVPFRQFSRQIQIARAFTCFQLTEMLERAPLYRRDFPAEIVIVTAFPELYFDEDVRDWNARVAFERGLAALRRLVRPAPRSAEDKISAPAADCVVALFSSAQTFMPSPARRQFLAQICAGAAEVWTFRLDAAGRLELKSTPHARVLREGKV